MAPLEERYSLLAQRSSSSSSSAAAAAAAAACECPYDSLAFPCRSSTGKRYEKVGLMFVIVRYPTRTCPRGRGAACVDIMSACAQRERGGQGRRRRLGRPAAPPRQGCNGGFRGPVEVLDQSHLPPVAAAVLAGQSTLVTALPDTPVNHPATSSMVSSAALMPPVAIP